MCWPDSHVFDIEHSSELDCQQVATSTPQLETTGYIYNTASCSLADKQEDHHSLW